MDDDQWKADGSFRGMSAGGGGGGKGKKRGKGPQFTRVIPKFLQKYHQAPAIQAKFAALPKPGDDEDDGELDEVQQAAMDAYLAKQQDKKDAKQAASNARADGDARGGEDDDAEAKPQPKKRKKTQQVAQLGAVTGSDKAKPKRKKPKRPALSDQKLLSFSMDDEE